MDAAIQLLATLLGMSPQQVQQQLNSDPAGLEKSLNTTIRKQATDLMAKDRKGYEDKIKALKRQAIDQVLRRKVADYLTANNAILPQDLALRQKRIEGIIKMALDGYSIEAKDDDYLITTTDGHTATTPDGLAYSLEGLLRDQLPTFVNFGGPTQRQSSGLQKQQPLPQLKSSGGKVLPMPTTQAEMDKVSMDYSYGKISRDDYKQLKSYWDNQA